MARLYDQYRAEIRGALQERFNYQNPMQIRGSRRSCSTWASARRPRTRRSCRPRSSR